MTGIDAYRAVLNGRRSRCRGCR